MKNIRICAALLVAALCTAASVTYAADPRTNFFSPPTKTQAGMVEQVVPAVPWRQLAKLSASDGKVDDFFGDSVAVSGDGNTVVAGAPFANEAYVFVKPASGWSNMTQVATLKPSGESTWFGTSVAISGNTVVVGNCLGCGTGAAYVFVKPTGGWVDMTENAKLTNSDAKYLDDFGNAVSISGNAVVVGAPCGGFNGCAGPGEAYVFIKPASGWTSMTETARLTASDGQVGDFLGWGVSVSGNTVVAAAPSASCGSGSCGAVYVFVEPARGWANMTETAKLSRPVNSSGFGYSVANNPNSIVVGAEGDRKETGAIYVFEKPKNGWKSTSKFTARLTARDGVRNDLLGFSVSIDARTIVGGAPQKSGQTGAAYVFVEPRLGWKTTSNFNAELKAAHGARGDLFASSVAIRGNTIVSGACCATIGHNTRQGAAYIFGKETSFQEQTEPSGKH
jgi:hypothetical protein